MPRLAEVQLAWLTITVFYCVIALSVLLLTASNYPLVIITVFFLKPLHCLSFYLQLLISLWYLQPWFFLPLAGKLLYFFVLFFFAFGR
jgi:hypothetical protein